MIAFLDFTNLTNIQFAIIATLPLTTIAAAHIHEQHRRRRGRGRK